MNAAIDRGRNDATERTFTTTGEAYAWALGYLEGSIGSFLSGVSTKADLRAAAREASRVVERARTRLSV